MSEAGAEAELAALRARVAELEGDVAAGAARVEYVTRGLPVGILETDEDGFIVTANDALREIVGRDPVVDRLRSMEMIHADDLDHVAKIFLSSLEPDFADDWTIDFRIVRPDGGVRWIRSLGRTHFTPNGAFKGVLSTWLDITGEMTARSSMDRLVAMLNAIADPVMIVDDQTNVVFENEAAHDTMLHWADERGAFVAPTKDFWKVMLGEAIPAARRHGHWTGEIMNYDATGEVVPYLISLSVERDPTTGIEYVTSIARDISALKRAEEVLRREATRDVLTGLPNRRALFELLPDALARTAATGATLAVLFVDLDGFKRVNDVFGHAAGDAVLVDLGRRITAAVRSQDAVARIGGDEFVVVCEGLTGTEAEEIAQQIVDVSSREVDVPAADLVVTIGASVGVAYAEPGMTADDIVRSADRGVYVAKAAGRGRWEHGH